MTEASPIILGNPLHESRRAGFLGIPFPSTEVRIVNPENPDQDVADGEVGELLARGPQIFAGYWDDEEETKQVFHHDWLRTGDLVRVDNGFIRMADRRKELIISGGFNIYPSQVEDAVRTMPGVEDVAVVGVPAGVGGEAVVAALTLEAGATVTLEDVRQWAEKSIAHYALPRRIVVMSELPRSQIGKVMRRRVKEYILDAGERLQESGDVLRERLQESSGELVEQLRASSEAAQEQIRGISEQVSEHVGATAQAASMRLREIQTNWSRQGSAETTRKDTAETDDPLTDSAAPGLTRNEPEEGLPQGRKSDHE